MGKGPTAIARAFSDSKPTAQLSNAGTAILSETLPGEKLLQNSLDRIALQNIKDET